MQMISAGRSLYCFFAVALFGTAAANADNIQTGGLYLDAESELRQFIEATGARGYYGSGSWGAGLSEVGFAEFVLEVFPNSPHEVLPQVFNNIAGLIDTITQGSGDYAGLRIEIADSESTFAYRRAYEDALESYTEQNVEPASAAEQTEMAVLRDLVAQLRQQRNQHIERYRLANLAGLRDVIHQSLAQIEALNTEIRNRELELDRLSRAVDATVAGTDDFLVGFHRELRSLGLFSEDCPVLVSDAVNAATTLAGGFGKQPIYANDVGSCLPVVAEVTGNWETLSGEQAQLRVAMVYRFNDDTWNLINIRSNFESDFEFVFLFDHQGAPSGLRLNNYRSRVEFP